MCWVRRLVKGKIYQLLGLAHTVCHVNWKGVIHLYSWSDRKWVNEWVRARQPRSTERAVSHSRTLPSGRAAPAPAARYPLQDSPLLPKPHDVLYASSVTDERVGESAEKTKISCVQPTIIITREMFSTKPLKNMWVHFGESFFFSASVKRWSFVCCGLFRWGDTLTQGII